jgi:hypothetical protein
MYYELKTTAATPMIVTCTEKDGEWVLRRALNKPSGQPRRIHDRTEVIYWQGQIFTKDGALLNKKAPMVELTPLSAEKAAEYGLEQVDIGEGQGEEAPALEEPTEQDELEATIERALGNHESKCAALRAAALETGATQREFVKAAVNVGVNKTTARCQYHSAKGPDKKRG